MSAARGIYSEPRAGSNSYHEWARMYTNAAAEFVSICVIRGRRIPRVLHLTGRSDCCHEWARMYTNAAAEFVSICVIRGRRMAWRDAEIALFHAEDGDRYSRGQELCLRGVNLHWLGAKGRLPRAKGHLRSGNLCLPFRNVHSPFVNGNTRFAAGNASRGFSNRVAIVRDALFWHGNSPFFRGNAPHGGSDTLFR